MSNLTVKTSHGYINETATIFYKRGYDALCNFNEQDINIFYLRKKIFHALIREIILAVDSEYYVTDANRYAMQVIDGLHNCSKLLSFMDNFIMDENFRSSICRDIANRRFDRVITTIQINCIDSCRNALCKLGNLFVIYMVRKRTNGNSEIKRLEMGIILNSLMSFMIEVYKIKINTRAKSVFGRLMNEIFTDLHIKKFNCRLYKIGKDDYINYTRDIEQVFVSLLAIKQVSNVIYKEIVEDALNCSNIEEMIADINTNVIITGKSSALNDIGLMSLAKYY